MLVLDAEPIRLQSGFSQHFQTYGDVPIEQRLR